MRQSAYFAAASHPSPPPTAPTRGHRRLMAHQLQIKTATIAHDAEGALVIYVGDGEQPSGAGAGIWTATGMDWTRAIEAAGFKGKAGHALDLIAPANLKANRLIVLGSGKAADPAASATAWTDRGGSLAGKLMQMRVQKAAVVIEGDNATPER